MLYAAMTFWFLVIVFAAYGVYQLWTGLVNPRTVNILLLPGTLIAQIGHVVGLLVTGGTINDTALIKDEKTAAPSTSEKAKSEIPVIGPIVVALLPILACGFSIYVVVSTIGRDVLIMNNTAQPVSSALPTNMAGFWQMLRDSITVVEEVTLAIFTSDFGNWQTWLFIYLLVCLSVRMAPLPGTQRGAVGAILVMGLTVAIIGMAAQITEETIQNMWRMLSFSVAILLFLMIMTLIARGSVGLFKILTEDV